MNRKQKIIVSITGIFIVLLALVGLTYAYFLTRITGNENEKSISVTAANLELVYGDNSAEIIRGTGALMPTVETDVDDAIGTKTFTVTNNGKDSSYVVIIDNVSVTKASDGSSTTFVSNDFRYTLSCSVKDKSGNVLEDETCNKVSNLDIFPINGGILVNNDIPENRVHEYTLTLWYIDTGLNQSDDMGKTYQARVNIADVSSINPYNSDTSLLAYNIINNAMTLTTAERENGYAELLAKPKTTVAASISESYEATGYEVPEDKTMSVGTSTQGYYWTYGTGYTIDQSTGKFSLTGVSTCQYNDGTCNNTLVGKYVVSNWASSNSSDSDTAKTTTNLTNVYKITSAPAASTSSYISVGYRIITNIPESTLSVTRDEYGISYYYRGAVKNNYLEFNGMCWRIVRIEGDGSIKITLAAQKACSQITAADTESAFIGTGNYGYSNGYNADYENSQNSTTTMKYKFNIFLNGGSFSSYNADGDYEIKTYTAWSATNLGKLKSEEVCIGDAESAYTSAGVLMTEAEKQAAISNEEMIYFKNYIRLYTDQIATLMCDTSGNKTTSAKIYPLTADEVVFAGGKVEAANYTYYLRENATNNSWWTLSPAYYDSYYGDGYAFIVYGDGYVDYGAVYYYGESGIDYGGASSLRPAVSLASGAKIATGDGTKDSPYTIQ